MPEYIEDYCPMGGNEVPEGAAVNHPRKRRQRAQCPTCKKMVAMTKARRFFPHWKWVRLHVW